MYYSSQSESKRAVVVVYIRLVSTLLPLPALADICYTGQTLLRNHHLSKQ